MSSLEIKIIDLDFPVGSKNKTATLITGERDAMLVDAGFTPSRRTSVLSRTCWTPARP